MHYRLLFLSILLFHKCLISEINAQKMSGDMELLKTHVQKEIENGPKYKGRMVKLHFSYNPLKMVLYIPLFGYQKVLSEQISAVCSFEPSCSAFCVQSIQQLGALKGLFLAADRLTRCNGQAQSETQDYLIDHHQDKVIDEPVMYKIKD